MLSVVIAIVGLGCHVTGSELAAGVLYTVSLIFAGIGLVYKLVTD